VFYFIKDLKNNYMKDKTLVYGALIGVGAYIYFKNKKTSKEVVTTTEESEQISDDQSTIY
jgi:hypothetical protein